MPTKKEYFIELFLKFSKHWFAAEHGLKAGEEVLRGTYPSIPNDQFKQVMSEHGIEEYVKKITPLIDSMFSLEELEELNAFFASAVGKKITDKKYLLKLPVIINDIFTERNSELSKMER